MALLLEAGVLRLAIAMMHRDLTVLAADEVPGTGSDKDKHDEADRCCDACYCTVAQRGDMRYGAGGGCDGSRGRGRRCRGMKKRDRRVEPGR